MKALTASIIAALFASSTCGRFLEEHEHFSYEVDYLSSYNCGKCILGGWSYCSEDPAKENVISGSYP